MIFMSRHLKTAFITLFIAAGALIVPGNAASASTLNAGFIDTLEISPAIPREGEHARVYGRLRNTSDKDLTGTVQLLENKNPRQQKTVAIAHGDDITVWFDITIPSSPLTVTLEFVNGKTSISGEPSASIYLAFATSSALTITHAGAAPSPPPSSSPNSLPLPSTTSSTSSTRTWGEILGISSSSPATTSTTASSTLLATVMEKTKTVIDGVSETIIPLVEREKEKNKEQQASSTPLPLLEKAAQKLEEKNSFLRIPRDELPSIQDLKAWGYAILLFALKTWWVMLIIYLLLFRSLYILWRRVFFTPRPEEE